MVKMHFYFYKFCLLFASVITPACPKVDYDKFNQANIIRMRFQDLMRQFYEEDMQRVKRINYIRFKYEENPYFEMGYVIGEIIEKYRKQVELVKYLHDYKAEILYRRFVQLHFIMYVYIETYHLYNMFHEISRKYAYIPEFKEVSKIFDSYIDALDQTCDEYDTKCRTETQMGDVFKSITEERERESQGKKEFKKLMRKYRERFLQAYVNGTLYRLKNDSFMGMYDPMHRPPGHQAQGETVYNVYANNDKFLYNLNRLENTSLYNDYFYMLSQELKRLEKTQQNKTGIDVSSIFAKNISRPKQKDDEYFLPLDNIYWKKERAPADLIRVKKPMRPKQKRPYPIEYGWSNEDVFFQGWDKDEPDENTTFIYSNYKPPPPSTSARTKWRKPTTTRPMG